MQESQVINTPPSSPDSPRTPTRGSSAVRSLSFGESPSPPLSLERADAETSARLRNLTYVAGKAPRICHVHAEPDSDDDVLLESPDLGEYFSQFELSAPQCIALCRTYANYLASVQRSHGKRQRSE